MRIRDLLSPKAIDLSFCPASKSEAIEHLVELLAKTDCLNDPECFREAVLAREKEASTGLGGGVAIPHAKSSGVDRPALAAMVVKDGVDFESVDGQPAYLLFMIASPHQASNEHIDVLAHLSSLLIDEEFRTSLSQASSVDAFLAMLDGAESSLEKKQEKPSDKSQPQEPHYRLVAVTACPAGLSHTYMAAESLEKQAAEMGISIKVEADGAAGNRNRLTASDIAHAEGVIVAADRAVDMDRFIGKRLVRVGVISGIRTPEALINQALDPSCPEYNPGLQVDHSSLFMRLYRHLMSGLTYIMPLAATAGILSALNRTQLFAHTDIGMFLDTIGYSIGTLLFPVLSAFIAFSIGGRTALVAGFTGGVMAAIGDAGVIGAVVNGFVGGGLAYAFAALAQRFLNGHDAMFALLVYPLVGALGTTVLAQYVTNLPAGFVNDCLEAMVLQANAPVLIGLGGCIGGLMAVDTGGPFNKLAYAFGVLFLADTLPLLGAGSYVMAAVMAGGMTPPIAAAIASGVLGRGLFSREERRQAPQALIKGCLFITEGVIPYLSHQRNYMLTSCILGSALAGALSMYAKCAICAPHGGVFILPISENTLVYCGAILAGSLLTALLFVLVRLVKPLPQA
ncbi:MAG: fructose-specific PTS transporter subunit EIIC [Succinivibrio sp.]|nr:fructose-specific PTS transporter subunit EIIC [Succinivibrio sp.]